VAGAKLPLRDGFTMHPAVELGLGRNRLSELVTNNLQKFVQIPVEIRACASIGGTIIISFKQMISVLWKDSVSVDVHYCLGSRFLLNDAEEVALEILRSNPYDVAVSLPQVAAEDKCVSDLFKSPDFLWIDVKHAHVEMGYVADFVLSQRKAALEVRGHLVLVIGLCELATVFGCPE
jgi:hypothetical protein